ncbi:hypothetical protein AAFF_G00313780 [Aldrovandia affinis]|uniref:THD domain-containing protein n=1 Tax=Aldrovandia affinis TaxID=143900 RepID=A0AAD7R7J2_9TELE|nr:hypothetical protein AAFF_G00313780 [Aldrovandia affinis]
MKVLREEETPTVLDVEQGSEQEARGTPSRGWGWAAGLLTIALCASATIILTWHPQNQDQSENRNGLQLKLRQLAGIEKDAIHLTGEYDKEANSTAVTWIANSDHGFIQGKLALEGNKIVIPHNGLYFVYSQASFYLKCGVKQGDPTGELLSVRYALLRWSDSYGRVWKPLLNTERSVCRRAEGEGLGYSGIYLGAIFKLQEGDMLATYVPNHLLSNVEENSGQTFFGAFAL